MHGAEAGDSTTVRASDTSMWNATAICKLKMRKVKSCHDVFCDPTAVLGSFYNTARERKAYCSPEVVVRLPSPSTGGILSVTVMFTLLPAYVPYSAATCTRGKARFDIFLWASLKMFAGQYRISR